MTFPFNFIIIPAVIIAVGVIGTRYTQQGVTSWYMTIKKPSWTPPGSLIGAVWTFLYILTGLAVLWYWNVPVFSWVHYVVAGILLINAYLNAMWSKIFFVEHNLEKAFKQMNIMNATTIVATVIIFFSSAIAGVMMIPYILWVAFATYLTAKLIEMNKSEVVHEQKHTAEN